MNFFPHYSSHKHSWTGAVADCISQLVKSLQVVMSSQPAMQRDSAKDFLKYKRVQLMTID